MKRRRSIVLALLLLVLAPLAGGLIKGLRPGFFDYPPLEVAPPVHAPFSQPVFLLFAAAGLLAIAILLKPSWFGFGRSPTPPLDPRPSTLPPWGWFGLILTAVAWICAWGRFEWLGFMKDHMFAPLWFGYVFTMDGLVYRRTGSSLLARAPATFAALFPASAISWWYFEYLNRFVRNWWYRGIEDFGPLHYIFYSCICFATVLPGIFETYAWLKSFGHFGSGYSNGPALKPLPRPAVWGLVAIGIVLYVLLGAFPDPFFFATWLAPLLVLAGLLALTGIETPFHHLRSGNWRALIGLGTAALVCGFFWEMWNSHSLPQWNYGVPYVHAFKLFEMPAVGYTGYLPFGPVCWCFWLALREFLPGKARERLAGLDL
ncbi:MAG: hypothetical protein JXB04_09250 [Kiritimatiellae bacterium]|nr:hypothetical protein [Kiritimatiellia bacterium]